MARSRERAGSSEPYAGSTQVAVERREMRDGQLAGPIRRRPAPPALLAAVALAAAALAATGCGGNSEADYVDEYNKVDAKFAPVLRRGLSSIQSPQAGRNPSRLSPQLENAADRFDETAGEFGEIDAPDDIKPAHDDYVAAIGTLGDDFRKAAVALRTETRPSPRAVRILRGLARSKGFQEVRTTGEALRRKVNE